MHNYDWPCKSFDCTNHPGATVYCPDEGRGPDERECVVIYNSSDHYNSTGINTALQDDPSESKSKLEAKALQEKESRESIIREIQ